MTNQIKVHDLKEWPATFKDTTGGKRSVQFRNNDRGFAVGDILHIREWQPNLANHKFGAYTGRECHRKIEEVHESTLLYPGHVCLVVRPYDIAGFELTETGRVALTLPPVEEVAASELDGTPATAPVAGSRHHPGIDALFDNAAPRVPAHAK